jgi:hypothetical protein
VALNQLPNGSHYKFMDMDACCTTHLEATYVVAISWGCEVVQKEQESLGF